MYLAKSAAPSNSYLEAEEDYAPTAMMSFRSAAPAMDAPVVEVIIYS
jgi:hypothetical protein